MAGMRPWEAVGPAAPAHLWEAAGYDAASDSDAIDNMTNTEPQVAAARFLDALVELHLTSAMSAQPFAVLCFWAARSGMPGLVKDYGMKPGCRGGNYQRHLDKAMGFDAVSYTHLTLALLTMWLMLIRKLRPLGSWMCLLTCT